MPPRYQAGQQSLFGGPGSPQAPRPSVDVVGLADVLTSGATSLLQQRMLRQQAANELELQKQHLQLQREQSTREGQRETREAANSDRDFKLREQAERHRFLEAGGIPEHTETEQVAEAVPMPAFQATPSSRIRSAMSGMPGVQVTPSNAPASTGPTDRVNANPAPAAQPTIATAFHPETTHVGESVDPTKASAFIRATEVARMHEIGLGTREEHKQQFSAEQQAKRLAAQQAGREYGAQAAKDLVAFRDELRKRAKTEVEKKMTADAIERRNVAYSAGYLAQFENLEDAVEALRSPDGAQLRAAGVTENHLLAAFGKQKPPKNDPAIGQILGLVNSGAAKDVADAAGKVKDAKAAADGMKPRRLRGGAGALPYDFTQDEKADAFIALKDRKNLTDNDIAAWILDQRKKKAGKK